MIDGLTFLRYDRKGTQPLGEFSAGVLDYRQQWLEGPAEASWRFRQPDSSGVLAWFNNYFMNQIRVFDGGSEIWRGWVWQQEAIDKSTHYGTMADVNNRVKVKRIDSAGATDYRPREVYTDDATDEEEGYTVAAWLEHRKSLDKYGPLEHIEDTATTNTKEAEAYGRMVLARTCEPAQLPPNFEPSGKTELQVTCVGAMGLANRILLPDELMLEYVTAQPDGPDDYYGRLRYAGEDDPTGREWGYTGAGYDTTSWTVGDEIRRIVAVLKEATGIIYPLDLAENDTETAAGVSSVTPAWDRLRQLASTPNSNGQGYALQMAPDGGVIYKLLADLPVVYRVAPDGRGITFLDGTRPRWGARPGILELVGNWGYQLPGTWTDYANGSVTVEDAPPFLPPGQMYIERVDMADGDEVASFGGRRETPSDYRRALDREIRRVKRFNE